MFERLLDPIQLAKDIESDLIRGAHRLRFLDLDASYRPTCEPLKGFYDLATAAGFTTEAAFKRVKANNSGYMRDPYENPLDFKR